MMFGLKPHKWRLSFNEENTALAMGGYMGLKSCKV